ncbi:hypothetical protein A3Q56_07635 [Intoshia linei]|uniref:Aldehyde dehydrogenase domain-containing protein n=1 Tax=Intoshia linei TaxID=1819745 RepID=A0A177ATU5_9BILA|nr:hypothetical protein A3Q56_07635 [Intoshia linei]
MLKLLKVYQNTRKFNTIPKPVDYKKFINKQLFINNQFVNSISSNQIYFDTVNPANEQVLSHICQASLEDVNYAVECARNAGVHNSIWKKMGANGRADLMYKLANLMERDRTILAVR